MSSENCAWCAGKGRRDILHRGTNELHSVRCACQHELPVPFVYQTENSGCCIATVAMIVQIGYAVRRRYRHDARLKRFRDVWPCAPWADLHWCEVRNTRDSGQHAVVLLRDGRVLDPWWGVLQGLHRYPGVVSIAAVYPVEQREGAA